MSKGNRIRQVLTSEGNSGILDEDMDDALIGIYRNEYGISLAVYSYVKYTELLIRVKGLSEEAAVEHADTLVYNSIVSDNSYHPLLIDDTGV